MSYKYFAFDLETIPQDEANFTGAQKRQLEKKKSSITTLNETGIMSTDPFLGKIIVIAMYYKNTYYDATQERKKALYGDNEKTILTDFWNVIAELDANTRILTFNGFNFDIPWVRIRSLINDIPIPKCKLDFFNLNPFKNTPHTDLMIELKGDRYNRMVTVGLGLACEACGIPSPKSGDIDGSHVYEAYMQGKIGEIADYSLRDTVATGMLYEKMKELKYLNAV